MSAKPSMYQGSHIFAGLTEYTGLRKDEFNFIITQFGALILSTLYRTALHPSKTTTEVRHAYGLSVGIIMGYFCFGFQAIHLAGLPAICYMIMLTQNPHVMHGMVLTVALIYLSCIHLHRQIYDYNSLEMDITGPLMVITQKVTALAFCLHDGLTKKEEEMTHNQKYHAVHKTPNLLEYFSYSLLFPSLMAGPVIFYNDYIRFVEGNTYVNGPSEMKHTQVINEPSPVKAVIKKVVTALFCAYIFVKFLPRFPIDKVKETNFVESSTMGHLFWYLTVSLLLVRCKYYYAWTMADGICNNCGIGFSGYTESGTPQWDNNCNVDILQFEFGTSLKESIEAWNKGTNIWLRMIVYKRTTKYSTVLTYILSAVWHGFYPGYYLTFLSGAVFTFASRTVRRHVRNYFLGNTESKLLYDLMTFAVTRFVLAYTTFPFVILDFWSSIMFYNKMYWCLHIGAVAVFLFLPKFVPKSRPRDLSSKSGIALALKQAGPYSK